MCGISGMVLMNNVSRSYEQLSAIRFIFDELLVETQDRGHHATGLAVFQREGAYDLHKSAVAADMFTVNDSEYDKIIDKLSDRDSVLLAHTRWYTKGLPSNNNNNHPFDIDNVVGVHNGTLTNDDQLFDSNKENFKRIAEVDSEIIYQLINFHNQDAITYEGLKVALEDSRLRGYFALAFVHKKQPHLLHIIKQERPMDIFYWEEAGVVIFNSDKKYIFNAFAALKRIGKRFGIKNVFTLKEYKLADDSYITIDANASSFEEMISTPQELLIASPAKVTYVSAVNAFNNTTTNYTRVRASDSIGTIIEGELDTVSGEVILFTSVNQVGDSDDGSGIGEDDDSYVLCIECDEPLEEHELHASYNEGARETLSYYCRNCHEKAITGVFDGEKIVI